MATRSGPRFGMVGRSSTLASANHTRPMSLSSTTPTDATAASRNGIRSDVTANLAEQMTAELLELRRRHLNSRRAKSRYVDCLRRDMSAHKVKPVQMLLAVLFEDIGEKDMPVGAVTAWLEKLLNVVKARAREITHDGVNAPSLVPLFLSAQRAEAAENEAETLCLADGMTVEEIDAVLSTNAVERQKEDRRNAALVQLRAELVLAGAK
jgi:hypothetical protein